jgi:hypothetical protein
MDASDFLVFSLSVDFSINCKLHFFLGIEFTHLTLT